MATKDKQYFVFHKPYGVLSQYTDEDGNPGLNKVIQLPKGVYPVGRLDKDSEGLLLLTNDRTLNQALLDPRNAHARTYVVEVVGVPTEPTMRKLEEGVEINLKGKTHLTKPAKCRRVAVNYAERNPPVNRKKHPITTWIELTLTEGKNRQVRRMTAKVGHPTLRLIRSRIEELGLMDLAPGEMRMISAKTLRQKLKLS